MGGSDPPYLYDPPSRRQVVYPYSDFDPKAATRASWAASVQSAQPKPKREGPLIDFNKHPDSYMVITGSQIEHKPMSPKAKTWIKAIRWVQFAIRLLQLLGAAGTLICVICIRKAPTAQGWIMRVPPAWDVVISIYAVYHLARPAKSRTPASSASYHIFAMIMDGGLIPFYVFISIFANQNYVAPADAEDRWQSFFTTDWSTTQLLLATWIAAAVMAGLHLVSIAVDIYLTIMFRKIAKLPPDMNPLEDNLTSRRAAKHQYKNSEASVSTMSMTQKPGHMSSSTINLNENRFSGNTMDERTVPFRHSRMGSDLAFSPHNPESARISRQQFDERSLYQQAQSNRGSRQSFAQYPRSPSASPSKRGSYVETHELPMPPMPPGAERYNSERPNSFASARNQHDNLARFSSPAPNAALTNAAAQNQQQESLLHDTWFATDGRPTTRDGGPASPGPQTPSRHRSPVPNFSRPSPEPSPEPFRQPRLPSLSPEPNNAAFMPQPLRMNPPTPPLENQKPMTPSRQRPTSYQLRDPAPIVPQHTAPPTPRHASFHAQPSENYEVYPDSSPSDEDETATLHAPERHPLTTPAPQTSIARTLSVTFNATAASSTYSEPTDENAAPPNSYDDNNEKSDIPVTAASSVYSDAPTERAPLNDVAVNRSLTVASNGTQGSSVYSESAPSLQTTKKNAYAPAPPAQRAFNTSPALKSAGTPKGRAYGDLSAAMRGIRGNQGMSPGQGKYAQLPQTGAPLPPRHGGGGSPFNAPGGRVVSRSGADIVDQALYMGVPGVPEKSSRRRVVSGKVAEEGMAGGRW